MTREFDHVREAFAASVVGKSASTLVGAAESAWQTSRSGRVARALAGTTAVAARIRTLAIAVAIAAIMQPLLILMMPATVVPAVPTAAYIIVAMFALGAAWQADALVAAWPASRLARWIRR